MAGSPVSEAYGIASVTPAYRSPIISLTVSATEFAQADVPSVFEATLSTGSGMRASLARAPDVNAPLRHAPCERGRSDRFGLEPVPRVRP